jgi:hypothetical protein
MTTYLITLLGNPPPRLAGGVELDRRTVDAQTDRDLLEAVIDFVRDVEILKDGDTIRIEAQTGE